MQALKIAIAQLNLKVADIHQNTDKIIAAINHARDELHAKLIVFSELSITSYPPEDLLHRRDLYYHTNKALKKIAQASIGIDVVVGYPNLEKNCIYNAAAWIRKGKIIAEHHKQILPNYGVFDEKRYFTPGCKATIIEIDQVKVGLLLCEDAWHSAPILQAKQAGAQMIIVINASPYAIIKHQRRLNILKQRATESGLPIIYANQVGGQDDLIFDGDSMAIDISGNICFRAPSFEENIYPIEINPHNLSINKTPLPAQDELDITYQALVTGVRDYINKNNFPSVVIGLSGGIDSALTLAIAVDALGADRVRVVMMPSRYTADISEEDASAQAKLLGVQYDTISIKPMFEAFLKQLKPIFGDLPTDTTEENIQARVRGALLMAISNKTGCIVLTTGNKSEMAVGYATLYGDMAGGFCVLKDVYKTLVYQLANHRNTISLAIPQRVIDRPPSAELAPDQKDQDSLPPYDILDPIIDAFVEQDLSIDEIITQGFDEQLVKRIIKMIQLNEYKRYQAPPGPRITAKAFGRNRRYPITSGLLDIIL